MIDAKPIMNAITVLIEKHQKKKPISRAEFKKVDEMMDTYYANYKKKNPRAGPFDSSLSAWMIHEQDSMQGSPSYFWDLIVAEQVE